MSEWISVEEKGSPSQKDYGRYFAVKINGNPRIILWRSPQWDSGWELPKEWAEPTHYFYLPNDCRHSLETMD